MRDLVDHHYPEEPVIRVVLDNLSAHHPGALYEAFDPLEARRIVRVYRGLNAIAPGLSEVPVLENSSEGERQVQLGGIAA
jgi:hypothetical protein